MQCLMSCPRLDGSRAGQRAGRILTLIFVLWLLSLADLAFTLWAHAFTPFIEMNPLAAHLLRQGLLPSLIGLKLTTTGIGTWIFWRLRARGQAEFALWGLVMVYTMLAVRWSQYTTAAAGERPDVPEQQIAQADV